MGEKKGTFGNASQKAMKYIFRRKAELHFKGHKKVNTKCVFSGIIIVKNVCVGKKKL